MCNAGVGAGHVGGVVSDQVRLEALWRDHAPAIYGYAVRRTPSSDDAWDVVAEVFLIAWRRIEVVPQGDEARLWLFGTARHVLRNLSRSKRRFRDLATKAANEAGLAESLPYDPLSPVVRRALERLSDGDRELVLLTVWDDLSPAEAASVLGLSPGTVRVRLHRARSRLREHLADLGVTTHLDDPSAHATVSTTIQEMT